MLRLLEAHGQAGPASVRLGLRAEEARETDLLEEGGRRIVVRGERLGLPFRPFEIKTQRLRPRGAWRG